MEGNARTPSLDELLGQDRWLQALARRLVRDAATADDLVQETWFRALRARAPEAEAGQEAERRQTTPPHAPPLLATQEARPWLARVLRNVWRERGRMERARSRREAATARSEALPDARASVERIELEQRLASIVLALEEPYRSVVLWHHYEGISAARIAGRLGEPAARVRWRLMRARELLRERLDRDQTDWPIRFSVFLPLAERGLPPAQVSAGSAGLGGAASLGVLSMSVKTLSWVGAGLLLFWAASHLGRNDPGAAGEAHTPPALQLASDQGSGAPDRESRVLAAPTPERIPLAPTSGLVSEQAERAAIGFARLVGTVRVAESGQGLEGVEVVVFAGSGGSIQEYTITDAAGAFSIAEAEPGTRDVGFRLEGRTPRRVHEVRLEAGGETRLETTLEQGFPITVAVVDARSGAPIQAAHVQLIAGDKEALTWLPLAQLTFLGLAGETDPAGVVELGGGARGVYQALVEAEGYATGVQELLVEPDGEPVSVRLARGGVVFGTVLSANGTPAEGARVFLNPVVYGRKLDEFGLRENGLAADPGGNYRLEGVPEGLYYAVVLLPDGSGSFYFSPDEPAERDLERVLVEDSSEVRLDFHLPVPGHVLGRVVDAADAPVPDAKVSVSWGDFKPVRAGFFALASVPGVKESIHHETRSDGDGRFGIEGLRLSHRRLTFRVSREGYVANELELDVPAGATREALVRLERLGATITGRLTDPHGTPVAGQIVGAFENKGEALGSFFQAESRVDGSYELSVPEGARLHRVYPILRDAAPRLAEPERREGVPTGAGGVDFVLHPRVAMSGIVVDDMGTPVRDFIVHCLERDPEGGAERWDERRDVNRAEGRFELFVDPETELQLRFSAPGCDPATLATLESEGERHVVLRRAGDLFGVLLDREGRGVPAAVVALATLDSAIYPKGTEFAPRATTDAEGHFRLVGVPESSGGHLLVCPRRDDAPALLHFTLADRRDGPLELVLPTSRAVELEFRDSAGRALEGSALVIDPEGWPLEPVFETHLLDQASPTRGVLKAGRALFQLLPGSHHAVYIRDANQQRAFTFEVEDGGEDVQKVSFAID